MNDINNSNKKNIIHKLITLNDNTDSKNMILKYVEVHDENNNFIGTDKVKPNQIIKYTIVIRSITGLTNTIIDDTVPENTSYFSSSKDEYCNKFDGILTDDKIHWNIGNMKKDSTECVTYSVRVNLN